MSKQISQDRFTAELFALLDETFVNHHGYYLDRGTSLFETLSGIDAREASLPVGAKCASLAAQVAHVTFYLEVFERAIVTRAGEDADWGAIWRTVEAVTPVEWSVLKQQLEQTYRRISSMLHGVDNWDDEIEIGCALSIVVHTAYHLGEIRQALCTLR